MHYIKVNHLKYLLTFYKGTSINIIVLCDGKYEYIKLSLLNKSLSDFMDIIFKKEDMPSYIWHFFRYVERNSKITESEDKLGYIIYGPCIKKRKMIRMKYICIHDYNLMLKRRTEIMYDLDLSYKIADKYFKEIYEDIISNL